MSGISNIDVILIVENSARVTEGNWNDTLQFIRNFVLTIDAAAPWGRQSRLGLFVHASRSRRMTSVNSHLVLEHLLVVLERELTGSNASASVSVTDGGNAGVYPALLDARDDLVDKIIARSEGLNADRQMIVVLQHSPADDATRNNSTGLFQWFMDSGVYVTVIGKLQRQIICIRKLAGKIPPPPKKKKLQPSTYLYITVPVICI